MKKFLFVLVSLFIIFSFASISLAGDNIKITWTASQDPLVQEYSIHCGTDLNNLAEVERVPSTTTEYVTPNERGVVKICKICSEAPGAASSCTYTFVGILKPKVLSAPTGVGVTEVPE